MKSGSRSAPAGGFGRPWLTFAVLGGALLVYLAVTAKGGTPDSTTTDHLSHGAVIWDTGVLVFREGLEAILVLAAITASFMGTNASYRSPQQSGP